MAACSPERKDEPNVPLMQTPIKERAPIISYTLVNTYPHDSTCYTQGFLFHKGQLIESTGAPQNISYTRSLIGIVDLKTGKMDIKAEIDRNKYFGEGIAVVNNKIFQLTYTNRLGFIYDANTFQNLGQFGYVNSEGWGLTSNGKELIMSDGSNALSFMDPDKLNVTKTILVSDKGYAVDLLNELEYINGYVYANIYTTSIIVKIDPQTGEVIGKLDINDLFVNSRKRYGASAETNGIAYNPDTDKIYVTGKLWPCIYEISFPH
ncbi:MAG: glutaminyl-peptide cyclotransferase [Bacteroidia bacterium]|jgi:glutamine cyclotransferase|nr:glutaminyl-peptide cyclotransferase [Bacteroidia bacterium]